MNNAQTTTLKNPSILCVDDEKIILDSLKAQLNNYFEGNCVIEVAESAMEALEILEELIEYGEELPHVIISDQIMPRMKGDDFLSKASALCPNSMRILLTGQADKNDIINVINKAGLYRYISKPWDNMDLNLTVKEALLSYTKSKEIEIQRDQLLVLNQNLESKVNERTKELEKEKSKSDNLLANILPSEIVEEIRKNNIVKPRHFELATIAFIDIVGFTLHCKDLSPEEMVDHLNSIFQTIDDVVEKYGLEKIKTMGDGYMFGGGIPSPNTTNPVDVVAAALEILQQIDIDIPRKNNEQAWDLRIGIHSGELIAGVIGTKKFAYDVWGTTVNLASRLESSGQAGRVNISKATYELVKSEFECEARGKISVKNMGAIEMFFVNKKLRQ